ncbi:WD40/YVTN/BNR-like repeat-containing protein [Paraferrimonas haliotis]|uniref:WD40/YVTN/BNR-like repeat-containing protein n=1 Tax=Paraferrimonas haliotis TaxID=2013866 RepID=UPI000F78FB2B|nr:YCF48-related protein [Paraferrimonas haliotis]
MRYSFISSLAFFSGIAVASQTIEPVPSQIMPLAKSSLTLSVDACNGHYLAVGQHGQILNSEHLWQQMPSPTRSLLTKVVCQRKNALAVGHDASILSSNDGGNSWQLRHFDPQIETPLLDVLMLSETQGIAVGAYGMFYRSNDGGQNWQYEFRDDLLYIEDKEYLDDIRLESEEDYLFERAAILPHFNSLTRLSDGKVVIAGEMGFVGIGDDNAGAFERIEAPYQGSWFSVVEHSDGWIYFGGLRGNLYRSNATFDQWQRIDIGVEASINQLLTTDKGKLLAVTNGGSVLSISAAGEVTHLAEFTGEDLVSITQGKDGSLWLAGSHGVHPLLIK